MKRNKKKARVHAPNPTPAPSATAATTAHATAASRTTAAEMDVARAVDQELEWFFSYAEGALGLGSLSMLPNHLAASSDAANEEAAKEKALCLALTMQARMNSLPAQHTGVLRATFTPRRWPMTVVREFTSLTPVVVRLVCAADPWPVRGAHEGFETAAAKALARTLAEATPKDVRTLRSMADRLLASAVTAYVKARNAA